MANSSESSLPPGQQLAAPDKWPVVGERSPRASFLPWEICVEGLVQSPRRWPLADLMRLPVHDRAIDIHCVTRWSKPAVRFRGVRLSDLLGLSQPMPEARFVSFIARSERSHSTSLALADAFALETLVAWEADGEPLAIEHGGPVRVVVPGRYFYKSLKWLERIELLSEDRLGYWEAMAGYHNGADPWHEQRFMAPRLTRQEAAKVLRSRNWTGLDLRSLDARDRDLAGLMAGRCLLRDTDFRGCNLQDAQFGQANLSNARLQLANLQRASFADADLEGANLAGADLRGADFRGASLFGATFVETTPAGTRAANMDSATHIDRSALDALTPDQAAFLARWLGGPPG